MGGSFDPPHQGHVHISLAALKTLKLDAVWWLVSPQNPLKGQKPLPLEERVKLSEDLVQHPQILISDMEKDLGTTITYESVKRLKQRYSKTDFVWITGMDNALSLHKWNHWQELLSEICMVHLTRYPAHALIKNCPLRMLKSQKHVCINRAGLFPLDSGTTYWLMQKKMVNISSTQIRENNLKTAT